MRARLAWNRTATGVAMGVAATTAVAAGIYWFGLRDDAAAAEGPDVTTRTVAASLSTLEKSVAASGTLTPTVHEDVSFEAGGTVLTVDVAAGESVTAGQTLATIDTLTLTADLLAAKASLASAQARLATSEDDDDGSDAAEAQVAASAAQVEVAQAQVDAAAEALAGATLVAPVDGLLTEVNVAVGDVVGGGGVGPDTGGTSAAHFVIVGTDSWRTEVTVDDSEVALIAVGDQAELTVEDATAPVFGVVTEIGLVSTTTDGVAGYPVTIEVTGRPDGVHDGVEADVAIVYERRTDVLTVPSAAVRTVDGASEVTQPGDDGAQVTTPVTVGETVGDLTEIVSGLVEGDEVLVTVVTQSEQGGNGQLPGGFQLPEGFDPGEMQFPDGFRPAQGGRTDG